MSDAAATSIKTAAVICADLERNHLGLRSCQGELLDGKTVLRHTAERVLEARCVDEVIVFCPEGQASRVSELLAGLAVCVLGCEPAALPRRVLSQRKWALESWRGGIHEMTVFDETAFTPEHIAFLKAREVGHSVVVPGEAAFVDPELLGHFVNHHREHGEDMRFTFSQAAPGLAGWLYRLDLLEEIIRQRTTVGAVLGYQPTAPAADFINAECTYRVAQALCTSPYRYLADTQRSWRKMQKAAALREKREPIKKKEANAGRDALDFVGAMHEVQRELDVLPRELEIELTTAPSVRMMGYPHCGPAATRGPMRLDLFQKIVEDCRELDDICITLGGFGEPLAHPQLLEMLDAAKEAGIFGIGIETDALLLKGALAEQLAASAVDVISVFLDADSPDVYLKVKGRDGFEAVAGQVEAFVDMVRSRGGDGPLVLPHLVKTRDTLGAMESFYDRWVQRCGGAVIVGYNDFAGQIQNKAVMDMSPPHRRACLRIRRQMTILADGTVPLCSQDYRATTVLGAVGNQPVGEVWRGAEMTRLRAAHDAGDYAAVSQLCGMCKEWHR